MLAQQVANNGNNGPSSSRPSKISVPAAMGIIMALFFCGVVDMVHSFVPAATVTQTTGVSSSNGRGQPLLLQFPTTTTTLESTTHPQRYRKNTEREIYFHSRIHAGVTRSQRKSATTTTTSLNMFMGSDGGVLGVGTPELATILLVGYFILGPSDLYKLVKEVGKFIQNIRTLGTDITTSFESNMESQLQLQELRKAQQELNDAFSFRRSINFNEDEAANPTAAATTESTTSPNAADATTFSAAAPLATEEDGVTCKKKIRRRVKRRPQEETAEGAGGEDDNTTNNYPSQLDMPTSSNTATSFSSSSSSFSDPFVTDSETQYTPEELAQINADFDKYTLPDLDDDPRKTSDAWYDTAVSNDKTYNNNNNEAAAASSRFQQQLSGTWNDQILQHEDQLSPIGKVMEMMALLEQEKKANDERLEEEFRKRAENEQAVYQKQRQLLQDAVLQIQQQVAATTTTTSSSATTNQNATSTTMAKTTTAASKES